MSTQTPKEIINLLDTLLLGSNHHRRNILFVRALRFGLFLLPVVECIKTRRRRETTCKTYLRVLGVVAFGFRDDLRVAGCVLRFGGGLGELRRYKYAYIIGRE